MEMKIWKENWFLWFWFHKMGQALWIGNMELKVWRLRRRIGKATTAWVERRTNLRITIRLKLEEVSEVWGVFSFISLTTFSSSKWKLKNVGDDVVECRHRNNYEDVIDLEHKEKNNHARVCKSEWTRDVEEIDFVQKLLGRIRDVGWWMSQR